MPYVTGKRPEEAKKILAQAGLEAGIQDSVYADTARTLQVLRQSPDVDEVVKGRQDNLPHHQPAGSAQVEMPDLRGFSIKEYGALSSKRRF